MGGLIVFSGVALAFLLFQLIYPYNPPNNSDFSRMEENRKKFNRLETIGILWFFVSIGLISFLVFLFGVNLQDYLFSDDYDYIMKPPNFFWVLPGVILGFAFVRIPLDFIYKLYLKGDYHLYIQFTNMKHGFDANIVWRPMELILSIAGIACFILGLNWYVRIDHLNQIEVNELFDLKKKVYTIDHVIDIYHSDVFITKDGNAKGIDHYVVKMDNDYEWSSHIYGFFGLKEDDEFLDKKMEELSEKTGLIIHEVQQSSNASQSY